MNQNAVRGTNSNTKATLKNPTLSNADAMNILHFARPQNHNLKYSIRKDYNLQMFAKDPNSNRAANNLPVVGGSNQGYFLQSSSSNLTTTTTSSNNNKKTVNNNADGNIRVLPRLPLPVHHNPKNRSNESSGTRNEGANVQSLNNESIDVTPRIPLRGESSTTSTVTTSDDTIKVLQEQHNDAQQISSQHPRLHYVNARQFYRIVKRRETRAKLLEKHLQRRRSTNYVPSEKKRSQNYAHESRHKHALNRKRGPGGRFLKKGATIPVPAAPSELMLEDAGIIRPSTPCQIEVIDKPTALEEVFTSDTTSILAATLVSGSIDRDDLHSTHKDHQDTPSIDLEKYTSNVNTLPSRLDHTAFSAFKPEEIVKPS